MCLLNGAGASLQPTMIPRQGIVKGQNMMVSIVREAWDYFPCDCLVVAVLTAHPTRDSPG